MTCANPIDMSGTLTEAADQLVSASSDALQDIAAAAADEVIGGRAEDILNLVGAGLDVAQRMAEGYSSGQGDGHGTTSYASWGDASVGMGGRLGDLSTALGAVAAVAAFVPGGQPFAAATAGIATATGLAGSALSLLGEAYNDLDPGRNPGCDPNSTFPVSDFLNPPVSPLVIDLDGDGVELTALQGSRVHFDFEADGFHERTGWVASDDGFLALDANANGQIDNGHELFGGLDFNGFDALQYYDGRTGGNFHTDNAGGSVDLALRDGVIDQDDPIYAQLRVWRDLNQNGASDAGELMSLSDAGIASIDLGYSATSQIVSGHSILQQSIVALSGGGSGDIADVWFSVDRTQTVFRGAANPDDADLPDLHGFGNVKSLQLAMADDRDLADEVKSFVESADGMSFDAMLDRFQGLLFKWSGVEAAGPRGVYVDPRVVAFMETAHDETYHQNFGSNGGTANPGPVAGATLEMNFDAISEVMLLKFLSQVTSYNLLNMTDLDLTTTKFDVFFTSVIYDPETDGLFFDGEAFAKAFTALDLSNPWAVADANFLLRWLPTIQNALGLDAAEFSQGMENVFADVGANQVIPLLDLLSFEKGVLEGTTSNGLADFSDLPGHYVAVEAYSTINPDDLNNNIYFISPNLGTVTIWADKGVDRIVFDSVFNSASRTFSIDYETGSLEINFDELDTQVVLGNYFSEAQLQKNWDRGFEPVLLADELFFQDGEYFAAEGLAIAAKMAPAPSGDLHVGVPLADVLAGGAGDDTLQGGLGDDVLLGEGDNDLLVGGAGDDTINGGSGDDILGGATSGNEGRDFYVVTVGGGHDTIYESSDWENTLTLEGASADDVTLARSGNDLVIGFVGRADDSVRISGFFTSKSIDTIVLDDATWTAAQAVKEYVLRQAGPGADSIVGVAGAETIAGGAGNDLIQGSPNKLGSGDVFIYAEGDGDDTLVANSESSMDTLWLTDVGKDDVALSRVGDDLVLTITTGAGGSITLDNQIATGSTTTGKSIVEQVLFSDGSRWTAADLARQTTSYTATPSISGDAAANLLSGTSVSDGLSGGAGNDTLSGGSGGDVYFFAVGDGQDIIDEAGAKSFIEADILRIDALSSDVELHRNGLDVVVTLVGTSDQVRIKDFYSATTTHAHNSTQSLEFIEFADGELWGVGEITSNAWLRGTTGNDSISGNPNIAETLYGSAGNDTLAGRGVGDEYVFDIDSGHDRITGGYTATGTIVLREYNREDIDVTMMQDGGVITAKIWSADHSSSITFQTFDGVDAVEFADGSTLSVDELLQFAEHRGTSGNDTMYGSGRFNGGSGDDLINGRGSDTYVWQRGDGSDTIQDWDSESFWGPDTLILSDVDPGLVRFERVPTLNIEDYFDLKIIVNPLYDGDPVEVITIEQQFFSGDGADGLEWIVFGDGSRVSRSDIAASAPIRGGSSDERLVGTEYSESISGGLGDDTIIGRGGADEYLWKKGDGNDYIAPAGGIDDGSIDTLRFTDVLSSDVRLQRDGSDLKIEIVSTGETIVVGNQFDLELWQGIERIVFQDAEAWNFAKIGAEAALYGTSEDDEIYGGDDDEKFFAGGGHDYVEAGSGNDVIYGEAGDDTLLGEWGHDTLIGGAGFDVLEGGGGADTYVYGSGDGSDLIYDSGGDDEGNVVPGEVDLLRLDGLNFSDVTLSVDDLDLVVTVTATGETVRVEGHYANQILGPNYGLESDGVERIVFDDAVLNDRAAIDAAAGFVPVDHFIDGTAGADTLVGDYGPNEIQGFDGDDVIDGAAGDDILIGGSGTDTLSGGEGDDWFTAEDGDGGDRMDGGDGLDVLDLSAVSAAVLVDLLSGSVLSAGSSADTVLGIEDVRGGAGADTLRGDDEANGLSDYAGDNLMEGRGGDDYLQGGAGAETLRGGSGDDGLYGRDGDDLLEGGLGADVLNGDNGADTYLFELGDGADVIADIGGAEIDVLKLGVGITDADVSVDWSAGSSSVLLTIGASGDQILLDYQFSGQGHGIESVEFHGGGTWSAQDLHSMVLGAQISTVDDEIIGTPLSDSIDAQAGNDTVDGGAGNDAILGGAGADALTGGQGDDSLGGGLGADTFDMRTLPGYVTFGHDTIVDFSSADGDKIRVDANWTFSSLEAAAYQSGSDIVLDLGYYSGTVTIQNAHISTIEAGWFAFG